MESGVLNCLLCKELLLLALFIVYCLHRFKNLTDMTRHLSVHSVEPAYSCPYQNCTYKSRSLSSQNRHIRMVRCEETLYSINVYIGTGSLVWFDNEMPKQYHLSLSLLLLSFYFVFFILGSQWAAEASLCLPCVWLQVQPFGQSHQTPYQNPQLWVASRTHTIQV